MNRCYTKKPCRSDYMKMEEIWQERERSGWNPYMGEEEEEPMMTQQPPMMPPQGTAPMNPPRPMPQSGQMGGMMPQGAASMNPSWTMPQSGQMGGMMPQEPGPVLQPYFLRPDMAQILEEQKQMERDLRTLQSMYPQAAKTLLPYIMEECDKMEYEGSSMYAEYPDPTTVRNIQDRIYRQVKDQFDVQEEAPDDILSMQYDRRRRDPRGKNWLDDLVRVLLLQEMHHRRCRHRGCRRNY